VESILEKIMMSNIDWIPAQGRYDERALLDSRFNAKEYRTRRFSASIPRGIQYILYIAALAHPVLHGIAYMDVCA